MKIKKLIYRPLLAAWLIGWGCLLTNCSGSDSSDGSDDVIERPEPQDGTRYLRLASLTRSGEDPAQADPMKGKDVHLFLVKQGAVDQSGNVRYNGIDNNGGEMSVGGDLLLVKPGTDYQVFGFMPAMGTSSTLVVNETTGTMTVNGLPTVTGEDICVVIGVKAGLPTEEQPITPGAFGYHAPENTSLGYGISLLAEHLYSAAELKFKIDAEYRKLRHIVLKQVTLKNESNTVNVTIPFNIGNSLEPVGAISVKPAGSGTASLPLYEPDGGQELQTDATVNVSFYFLPGQASNLLIESVYDVYDTTGTPGTEGGPDPIRKDCTIQNNLTTLLGSLARGAKKNVTMTIKPTYLYVLSDPDADTPMVVAGD